jgi:hypothetical protein
VVVGLLDGQSTTSTRGSTRGLQFPFLRVWVVFFNLCQNMWLLLGNYPLARILRATFLAYWIVCVFDFVNLDDWHRSEFSCMEGRNDVELTGLNIKYIQIEKDGRNQKTFCWRSDKRCCFH